MFKKKYKEEDAFKAKNFSIRFEIREIKKNLR